MLSYDIEDQTGFPFDHLYGGVVEDAMDGLDCVLPITLESNVIKLQMCIRDRRRLCTDCRIQLRIESVYRCILSV